MYRQGESVGAIKRFSRLRSTGIVILIEIDVGKVGRLDFFTVWIFLNAEGLENYFLLALIDVLCVGIFRGPVDVNYLALNNLKGV